MSESFKLRRLRKYHFHYASLALRNGQLADAVTIRDIWNLGTPWYHIWCNDLLTTAHDIMVLWYHMTMISSFGDLWFHNYDIIDWHVWFHSHKIMIWFQGIITSYMISWVLISVLISYVYDIMRMISKIVIYDIMIVISEYDFMESLHHIWYHGFKYQYWYHNAR